MQVRLNTITVTEQDRRAVRFVKDKRKTQASRKEVQEFLEKAIERALRDLRYRWYGPQVDEAILNGADPDGLKTHEKPGAVVEEQDEDKSDRELAEASV